MRRSRILAIGFALLALPGWFGLLKLVDRVFERPLYDTAHPEFAQLSRQFQDVRSKLGPHGEFVDSEVQKGSYRLNVRQLNGGDWTMACVFGGFESPLMAMKAIDANVSPDDERRFTRPVGLRMVPVEEFEAVVAFADAEKNAHFIHLPQGWGSSAQHFARCIEKPETSIPLQQ